MRSAKVILLLLLLLSRPVSATTIAPVFPKTTSFSRSLLDDADLTAAKSTLHLNHRFDVRDYGALGNGTADDTSAIQAATNAARGHGPVWFPDGTYKITAPIAFDDSDAFLGAEGASVTITQATANTAVFQPVVMLGTVTGITKANPGVVTLASWPTGLSDGDTVKFASVGGMTELNGNCYIVDDASEGAKTFSLDDLANQDLDTSAYGTYTSGGTATGYETVAYNRWGNLQLTASAAGCTGIYNPRQYVSYPILEYVTFASGLDVGMHCVLARPHISDCWFVGDGSSYTAMILDSAPTKINFSINLTNCNFWSAAGGEAAIVCDIGNSINLTNCVFEYLTVPAIRYEGVLESLLIACNFENVNASSSQDCLLELRQNTEDPVGLRQGSRVNMLGCQFTNNNGTNTWDALAYTEAACYLAAQYCSGNINSYYTYDGATYDHTFILMHNNKFVNYQGGYTLDTTIFNLGIGVAGSTSYGGWVRFYEQLTNGTNYVMLQAPDSVTSNVTFKVPSADGTNGQVLQTNGSGVLSFTTPAGSGDMLKSTYDVAANNYVDGNDTAYNATTWDGKVDAPTMNAVRDKIETLGGGHDAVTLGADADVLLGLTTQQIDLDTQTANTIFSGPASGAAADPTFRTLVDDDIPDAHAHAANAIDAITEIAAALKSGADTTLLTGTAATTDHIPMFNVDGDLVDSTLTATALAAIDTEAELEALLDLQDLQGAVTDAQVPDAHSHAADAIDAIAEIATALKSGADTKLITGTAGTNGNLAQWNADGDAVDSSLATADVVTGSSTDTFTNKTFDADGTGNSLTNVDHGNMAATLDFSSTTLTGPTRIKGTKFYLDKTLCLPNSLYDSDTQWSIVVKTPAALTITNIEVSCDADPSTELDWDLKFADAFIGLANATLIVAMDTTAGAASISSGWTDNTVPSGKCIYVEFAADPDSAITQIALQVEGDFD